MATSNVDLLKPREVCVALRISRQTLARRIDDGHIRALRIGPTIRIPAAEVARLLDVSAPSPGVLLSARDGGAPTGKEHDDVREHS
jgi:excisionase family DNA binding protein